MISFQTMIPTHYNDGRPVPIDVRDAILDMASRIFGGYTLDAPGIGCHQGQCEGVQRLTVACESIDDARGLVKRMGLALDQRSMYFAVNNDTVEILKSDGCKDCENCVDCDNCDECFNCNDNVNCMNCEDCNECFDCVDCSQCDRCFDCIDCVDCLNCVGLTGKTGWSNKWV